MYCRSCLRFTDFGPQLPPSIRSAPRVRTEGTRSYLLLLAPSLLCTSTRPIKLIALSAYPIPRSFLFYHQASPLSLLKASFVCADTFSSFILFPHHVCLAALCSRGDHSSPAPSTFSLPPKFTVSASVLSCVFGLLLPLPRDTAHATFLPTLSCRVHSRLHLVPLLKYLLSVPQNYRQTSPRKTAISTKINDLASSPRTNTI